jgi:hypothetical protein
MNPRHLIDQIVRQTTVLIAQLSTTSGIRAPLAHVADQVFVELSREIESQGVSRKVAADMFGLALRTYQTRVQRLSQSQTMSDRTLWQAVLDFVAEQGNPSRSRIVERFRNDGELAIGAVLNDLTTSGLVSMAGKGPSAICRVTSDADRRALSKSADTDSVASLVWVQIYRDGPLSEAALRGLWPDAELLDRALGVLTRDQRIVKRAQLDGASEYSASTIAIPIGDRMGWEGAVLDHFQAVARAIAHKLRMIGATQSTGQELIGGATLTFDITDGHPMEAEVKGLLKRVRDDGNALWNRLKAHNERAPIAEDERRRVVFYFGQDVEETDDVQA